MGNAQLTQFFYYNRITLNEGRTVKWEMNGEYDPAFVVGALIAGQYAIESLQDNGEGMNLSFTATRGAKRQTAAEVIAQYKAKKFTADNDFLDDVGISKICPHLKSGFNIWLEVGYNVMLFNYSNPVFIQGLLTILRAFNVDYREMIIACPIKVTFYNGRKVAQYYQIEANPLPYFSENNDGQFRQLPPPPPLICDTIINPPDIVIPSMEDRLTLARLHFEAKFVAEQTELVNNLMEGLAYVLLYTDPKKDIRTIDTYDGYQAGANNETPQQIAHRFVKQLVNN